MRAICRTVLAVLVLVIVPRSAAHADNERLQHLEQRLVEHPEDVDARLTLAIILSWKGKREQSREHARRVVEQTPDYWGAHTLLARLDAWDGRYEAARERLALIPDDAPGEYERLKLQADMASWDSDPVRARPFIEQLLVYESRAIYYQRLAVIERQQLHYFAAWRLAHKALEVEQTYAPAIGLRDQTRLISTDVLYELEVSPQFLANERPGHGVVASATWLPRSWLSPTLIEEYRYRFGTHNNRLTLRGDWRVTPDVTLIGAVTVGAPAEVVSKFTASARVLAPIVSFLDVGGGYSFDLPAWGGHLHRMRVNVGFKMPRGFSANANYVVGLLARCGQVDDSHGTGFSGSWDHEPVTLSLHYAFGLELDRPPIPVAGLYTDEGCPKPGFHLTGPSTPVELSAHEVGLDVRVKLNDRVTVRGGFGTVLRTNQTSMYTTRLALRTWF